MRTLTSILCVFGLSVAAIGQTPGFWLTGLAPQTQQGWVTGLSQDGDVAAGYCYGLPPVSPYSAPGFTWTREGGRHDFGLEPGIPIYSPAFGISSDGQVVAGYTADSGQTARAYRRVGNGPLQNLGVLPNEVRSFAYGVSGDGGIVVGIAEHDVPGPLPGVGGQAFRWTEAGGMQGLGYLRPNGYHSEALAISRDGTTIVGNSQSNGSFDPVEAFTWTQGGMQSLPVLPGSQSSTRYAYAVNADGSAIVGASHAPDGRIHAARWTGAGVQDLGILTGTIDSLAYAVNDGGSVVGGVSSLGVLQTAFVWTGLGMTDLSSYLSMHGIGTPANYRLESILAISGDGLTFGGMALNLTTNMHEGFVTTIPSPDAAVGLLLAPLLVRRRRRGG